MNAPSNASYPLPANAPCISDEQILPATIFQDLNWHCVVTLFQAYVDTFLRSTEHDVYTTYAAEENSKRDEVMLEEFRRLRHARYIMLAKDTKRDDELRKYPLQPSTTHIMSYTLSLFSSIAYQ